MTVFPAEGGGGGIARELVVWGLNSRGAGVLGEFVRRFQGPLGLEKWEEGELDEGGEGEQTWRACWRQGETRCSRKQVAPMLREAMRVVARL
jgi:exopolyphosphatase